VGRHGIWPVALAAVVTSSQLQAQQEFRARGYFEHQFAVNHTADAWRQLDYDRFRVDLDARAGRGTFGTAAVVFQLYRGDTEIDVRDLLPANLASDIDSAVITLDHQHFLNHAYVRFQPGPVQLTVGKQYLTWGAAWAFNPTELFRPKDLFEPTYEREGVGALSTTLSLGSLSDVMVAFVPDGAFDTSGKLIRARHHVAGFDLSALAAVTHEALVPAGLGIDPDPLEQRVTVGGDVSGELLGLGIWAEGIWSDHANRRWAEITLGGNYSFTDGTLVLVEGYYNGRGQSQNPYPVESWLSRLAGSSRSLGTAMFYASGSRPLGQLWHVGMSVLGNAGDGSLVLIPSVAYAFAENVDVVFNGVLTIGGEGTEFGTDNQGGFLRGRVYF
jgi:hypothetical protein